MSIRKPMAFGWVRGGKSGHPQAMGALEVIKARSGRFITDDSLGNGHIADDGTKTLLGFVESGDITCSATEGVDGGTYLNCIDDLTAIFRVPLRFTAATYTVNYSEALIGKARDLIVVDNIQYVNLASYDDDLVIIKGGQAATSNTANDGFVYVSIAQAVIGAASSS